MDDFMKLRQVVLGQWPTGKDVDLDEAFAYQKAIPEAKRFSRKLSLAKKNGDTLIPVSYTHLDVYKRQVSNWASTASRPSMPARAWSSRSFWASKAAWSSR